MPDVSTPRKHSEMMSKIRGHDTQPEIRVRSMLHSAGFRFRLHSRTVVGKPDLTLPRYGSLIFVHGCFWHRHEGCRYAYVPKSNQAFWNRKFNANRTRDIEVTAQAEKLGWRVVIVWECETRDPERLLPKLVAELRGSAVGGLPADSR